MKIDKTCKTCEFGSAEKCIDKSKKESKGNVACEEWGASLEYFTEITRNAPWYIKESYDRCKITYDKFLEYLNKDDEGIGIKVNIYDAIERIYDLKPWELAGVLDVSMGVLGYARMQRTISKRKKQFSSRLHIPESFFDNFLSSQIEELKHCKQEFYEFYGSEAIEKFKKNGVKAMDLKMEIDIVNNKAINEKEREENQHKYQYQQNDRLFHDLSDDYKSRDYVISITLKEGDYFGNIFYEYSYGGYGLSVSIMQDILLFIENLNCEEIEDLNEEGLLNNNIGIKSDINGKEIHFELENENGDVLKKRIPEAELQNYIISYEMIRCDGHGMKKERRRCISCENFHPIGESAKGNCAARGDVVQRSRVICAFDFIQKEK